MAIIAHLPKDIVITILRHRGFTELRTKGGVKPLERCSEWQLWSVYRAGKTIRKKEVSHD